VRTGDPEARDDDAPRSPPAWRRYLHFWGARVADDVDAELRFHFDMRVRDYVARGMTAEQARHVTLARLGNLSEARGECLTIGERRTRRMTRAEWIDALMQDLHFAMRTLGRQKSWTVVAVLTLALGIGATTAAFSVVSNILLHPIAYPGANRVALLYEEPSNGNNTGMNVRVSMHADLLRAFRADAHDFEDIEAYVDGEDRTLLPRSGPSAVIHSASITPGFVAFAGARAIVGRTFTAADATRQHVAVLGEGIWRTRFGADPTVVGRTLTLDDSLYTIIGVLPATLATPTIGGTPTDVWLPIDLARDGNYLAVGRLRTGVSRNAARRELDGIIAHVSAADGEKMRYSAAVVSPGTVDTNFRDALLMLLGAVGLVLLIACANVAHLLLARTAARQRELSVRAALGAGTGRLFRQLLAENAVLAAAGGVGGLAAGYLALRVVVAIRPASMSQLSTAHLDLTALAVSIGLSVAIALAFGLLGARQTRRHSAAGVLRAPTASSSRRDGRVRAVLVVTEMALSAMLLVGAGLLVRSLAHLQQLDPGFDPGGLYMMQMTPPRTSDTTGAGARAFYAEVAHRTRALQGVKDVAFTSTPPTWFSFRIGALQVDDQPDPPAGASAFIDFNAADANYFRAMRIPLLAGTTFTDTSDAGTQVIVNEGFVKRYWPNESPLGHRMRVVYQGKGTWLRVVGVAGNTLSGGLIMDASKPVFYAPLSSRQQRQMIVRVAPGAANPIASLRQVVASLDPRLPPATILKVDDALAATIALPRFTTALLTAFTLLAVVLAAIGLYGVLAYSVAQRTREIGIRVALGAPRSRIARLVVAQAAVLALIGAAVGLLAAHRAARLLGSMLYGVAANDPWSFAAGGAVLLLTALIAALVPTRRALRVDPLVAMRAE
jgi:predicted permease